jgi:hypothetical protein
MRGDQARRAACVKAALADLVECVKAAGRAMCPRCGMAMGEAKTCPRCGWGMKAPARGRV